MHAERYNNKLYYYIKKKKTLLKIFTTYLKDIIINYIII